MWDAGHCLPLCHSPWAGSARASLCPSIGITTPGTSSLEPLQPSVSTLSPQPLLQSPLPQDLALDSPWVIMVPALGRPFPQIISAVLPCMAEMAHPPSQLKNGEKQQCPGLQVPLLFPSSCLHYFHRPKGMGEFTKKTMTKLWLLPRDSMLIWSLRPGNQSFPLCFAIGSLGKCLDKPLSVDCLPSIKQDQAPILQRHCEVISFSI